VRDRSLQRKQSHRQDNDKHGQKTLSEEGTLPLIESDVGTEEEKHCSFVVQKQVLLYIIHFMHILFSQFARHYYLNYCSEYATAFNNLTSLRSLFNVPLWKLICLNFVSVLFMFLISRFHPPLLETVASRVD
jgi:hypothetical protein